MAGAGYGLYDDYRETGYGVLRAVADDQAAGEEGDFSADASLILSLL